MRKNRARGFNLVEAAIVLGIVGLVIGGIWAAASTVTNNNNQQEIIKDIQQAVQNTRTLYASVPLTSCETITNPTNRKMWGNIFPASMTSNTSSFYPQGPWQDSIVNIAICPTRIDVTLGNVSHATCVTMGPKLYGVFKNDMADNQGDATVGPHIIDGQNATNIDTLAGASTYCEATDPAMVNSYMLEFSMKR